MRIGQIGQMCTSTLDPHQSYSTRPDLANWKNHCNDCRTHAEMLISDRLHHYSLVSALLPCLHETHLPEEINHFYCTALHFLSWNDIYSSERVSHGMWSRNFQFVFLNCLFHRAQINTALATYLTNVSKRVCRKWAHQSHVRANTNGGNSARPELLGCPEDKTPANLKQSS